MDSIFDKTKLFFTKMRDIIPADLMYVIPAFVKWTYQAKINKKIVELPLKSDLSNKVSVYMHGDDALKNGKNVAVLILHGLYGHPAVMMHLAEMAQKVNVGPVFSMYVVYGKDFDIHPLLIKQVIDRIEMKFQDQNQPLEGVVMVGHSMGGIESAYAAFVEKDKRILAVISIAGRLKEIKGKGLPVSENLTPSINAIYQGIQSFPDIPLYQIVGENDWSSVIEATLIRKDENVSHVVKKGMHLNILFHKDMYAKFPEFLKKASDSK